MASDFDAHKPATAFDHDSTLVLALETSGKAWDLGAVVPGVTRRPPAPSQPYQNAPEEPNSRYKVGNVLVVKITRLVPGRRVGYDRDWGDSGRTGSGQDTKGLDIRFKAGSGREGIDRVGHLARGSGHSRLRVR